MILIISPWHKCVTGLMRFFPQNSLIIIYELNYLTIISICIYNFAGYVR